MIDPASLVTLVAVGRTGSVVAAAADLGYTPSAVSQQVKRLERQIGAPLLDRVGRGVMLTELGSDASSWKVALSWTGWNASRPGCWPGIPPPRWWGGSGSPASRPASEVWSPRPCAT